MDLRNTTPPELGVPSFEIEAEFEANALAELSHNPGIKPEVMLDLAKRVLRETRGLSYKRQIGELEYLARKHHRMSTAETEAIINAARDGAASALEEPSHRVIGGAHLFTGYEAPERPDYHPHDDGPSAA
jgi:hypothetical protein